MNINFSPEVYLKKLNSDLNTLYKSVLVFSDSELEEKIINLMKKTIMTEISYDRYIIAVTGLQGVGKSTLMEKFYDIPEGYLPKVLGVGERIPILISEREDNSTAYEAIIKRFKKDSMGKIEIVDEIVEKKTFYDAAMDPEVSDICLELLVPKKFFSYSGITFMLLPGIAQTEDTWEDLARHSLNTSAATIITLNETKMAQHDNTVFMDMLTRDFTIAKPLITLTFSEHSIDGNAGLKAQVIERFAITEEEADRVICTGADKNTIPQWSRELHNAIRKYSAVQKAFRRKQIDSLDNLIATDLKDILRTVKDNLRSFNSDVVDRENDKVEKILNIIKKRQEKLEKDYETELSKELEQVLGRAIEGVNGKIVDESKFKKFFAQFTGWSLEKKLEFEKLIIDTWNEARAADFENEIFYNMLAVKYPLYKPLGDPINSNNENLALREAAATSAKEIQLVNSGENEHIQNLQALFANKPDVDVNLGLKRSLEYIPLLTLELMRINSVAVNYYNIDDTNKKYNFTEKDKLKLTEQLGYANTARSNVLKGIGVMLGVDAIDGTINSIPAILKAVGIEITAAVATPIVAAFGVIGIGALTANVIAQMNKADLRTSDQAAVILHAVKNNYFTAYSNNFKDSMNKVYDFLEDRLNQKFHCDESFARGIKVDSALADVKSTGDRIREVINEYRAYLV